MDRAEAGAERVLQGDGQNNGDAGSAAIKMAHKFSSQFSVFSFQFLFSVFCFQFSKHVSRVRVRVRGPEMFIWVCLLYAH